MYEIFNEDCLEGMKKIPDGSVDMVCTDLPFGNTANAWDKCIPAEPLWEHLKRVTKYNAAIVLFAHLPLAVDLISANRKMFRYEWIWVKNSPAGFLNVKKMPFKAHVNILVFYRALPTYNPQFWQGTPWKFKGYVWSDNYQLYQKAGKTYKEKKCLEGGLRYPTDVQYFKVPAFGGQGDHSHPTQTPVDLMEYLIKTYTNEGETVLDATMGSGSTGVAAMNTGRNFIGFEIVGEYYGTACKRIAEAQALQEQNLFKDVAACSQSQDAGIRGGDDNVACEGGDKTNTAGGE